MTREEAKKLVFTYTEEKFGRGYSSIVDAHKYTVDVIYDYFESRTCSACKYFGKSKKDDECPMEFIGDSTKEYCWKWEQR